MSASDVDLSTTGAQNTHHLLELLFGRRRHDEAALVAKPSELCGAHPVVRQQRNSLDRREIRGEPCDRLESAWIVGHAYHQWSTDHVIVEVERVGGDASQRLKTVMRFVAEQDLGPYEIVMMSWGVQESIVAKSFEVATRRRIEFIRSLFVQLGFTGQELEARSLAFVGYMRMMHSGDGPEGTDEHLLHLDERHRVLTAR